MFKKTKVEITKAEAVTPFKTAFVGGIYSALGTIVAAEVFELLSTAVNIMGEKIVEKINDQNQPSDSQFNEQFWDELFDESEEEEEE